MSVTPQMRQGHPVWWHAHGDKLLGEFDREKRTLVLKSKAAEVTISPAAVLSRDLAGRWLCAWEVRQSKNESIRGQVLLTRQDLLAMFCGQPHPESNPDLLGSYGGAAGRQGYFIRHEGFLNIPCPGTGHDGDPNVSIEVRDTMTSYVTEMLR